MGRVEFDAEEFQSLRVAIHETARQGMFDWRDDDAREREGRLDFEGWVRRCDEAARGMLWQVPRVELREGRALYAVQYCDANGVGRVWSGPAGGTDRSFVGCEPGEIAASRETVADEVGPDLVGDDGPEARLQAAILMYEFAEFRAAWHACSWSDHDIQTEWPAAVLSEESGDWTTFDEFDPEEPPVYVDGSEEGFRVVFFTRSDLNRCELYRHETSFRGDGLVAEFEVGVVARGRQGFVH